MPAQLAQIALNPAALTGGSGAKDDSGGQRERQPLDYRWCADECKAAK